MKLEGKGALTKAEKAYVKLQPREARRASTRQRGARVPDAQVEAHQVLEGDRGRPRQHQQAEPLRLHRLGSREDRECRGSNIYYQLFPAHEGMFPGYATAYAVVGEEIHAIEDTIQDDRGRVKFSTYLTGIGFPPRSIYRKMLQDFAAAL